MPEETIIAAIERFEADLEKVGPLIAHVERLDKSRGRLQVALALCAAAIVAICVLGWLQHRDRQAASLEACRLRNNTPALLRDAAQADIDATADLLTEVGVDTPIVNLYVQRRQEALPDRDDTDRDCNGDGQLTASDYPATTTARVGD